MSPPPETSSSIGTIEHEIADLQRRQQAVARDTAAITAELKSIRSTWAWRGLQVVRAARLAVRAERMRLRGLRARIQFRLQRRGEPLKVRELPIGVNVSGYLSTESGMGQAARASIRSLEAAGIPLALNNVASRLRAEDRSYTAFTEANPHPFNLVHLNGDNMGWFAAQRGREYFRGRYTIGYWFWELSRWRDDWLDGFNHVDEVWVATEFTRATLAAVSPVPIVRVRLPFVLPDPAPVGRAHFGLPERSTIFLLVFDVSSQTERKNPLGAIRAFRRAALPPGAATLVLKYTNAEYDRDAVRRFREEAAGLDVVMLDGYMSREELTALMQASDCYLSLHRSEGFGMTIAEAMLLGKPVIATNYSANVDFMTAANSYPVGYRLVTLTRDHGPYMPGYEWADPDVVEASRSIREVALHPERAAARGRQAEHDIRTDWSPARTGEAARQRFEAIRRSIGGP